VKRAHARGADHEYIYCGPLNARNKIALRLYSFVFMLITNYWSHFALNIPINHSVTAGLERIIHTKTKAFCCHHSVAIMKKGLWIYFKLYPENGCVYHKPSMSTEKNDRNSLLVVFAGNKEYSLEFTFLPWHRKDTFESTLRAIAILWVKSLIKNLVS